MIVIVALTMLGAETPPKFTADQCRVLKQVGVDVTGICPNLKPVRKKARVKR